MIAATSRREANDRRCATSRREANDRRVTSEGATGSVAPLHYLPEGALRPEGATRYDAAGRAGRRPNDLHGLHG